MNDQTSFLQSFLAKSCAIMYSKEALPESECYNLAMPKINVLPDFIASQIAAGEVVERPSSVVKELVENAIDAGAHQIEIAVGAECRDIRIADDGCGMSPDDAVLAFQRHATSKLSSAEDLTNLKTLGFRGEALPSIASVSRVSCTTRTADATNGTKVSVEEGKISAHETGCAIGTIIEICDLFYNVPARLKFLKKGSTEFSHIHEIVEQLALANPKIVFQLLNQGEVVLRTSGSGKLAEAMVELEFVKPSHDLIPITGVDMRFGMAVYGNVGRPPLCRGDRKGIVTIVNNRPVRCHLALKALDYAFSDLIPRGKYPIAVLNVTIDPHEVDVNVHPTKKEVRYSNSSDVYLAIQKALIEGTRRMKMSSEVVVNPGAPGSSEEKEEQPQERTEIAHEEKSQVSSPVETPLVTQQSTPDLAITNQSFQTSDTEYSGAPGTPVVRDTREVAVGGKTYQRIQQLGLRDRLVSTPPSRISNQYPMPSARKEPAFPIGWRYVGYIFNMYMLFETPEGFKMVEQHIAHERLLYEKLIAQQELPGRITEAVQRLIISAPLNLVPSQKAALAENLEFIQSLGFDFDFQPSHISCVQVPLELATKDYAGTIQQILEQILNCDKAEFSLEATKSLACQAAIKNGMVLTEGEIMELVAAWLACPRNDTCPHGRPICLTFSKEKLFDLYHKSTL